MIEGIAVFRVRADELEEARAVIATFVAAVRDNEPDTVRYAVADASA